MPLEDALSLIHKDYQVAARDARSQGAQGAGGRKVPSGISGLLGRAAAGASLSSEELNAVISALQKQKDRDDVGSSHGTECSCVCMCRNDNCTYCLAFLISFCWYLSSKSFFKGAHNSDKEPSSTEDIQRQQADLQAKILSLLGSNAVVPSSSPSSSQQPGARTDTSHSAISYPQPQPSTSSATYAAYGASSGASSGYSSAHGYQFR